MDLLPYAPQSLCCHLPCPTNHHQSWESQEHHDLEPPKQWCKSTSFLSNLERNLGIFIMTTKYQAPRSISTSHILEGFWLTMVICSILWLTSKHSRKCDYSLEKPQESQLIREKLLVWEVQCWTEKGQWPTVVFADQQQLSAGFALPFVVFCDPLLPDWCHSAASYLSFVEFLFIE